MWRSSTTRDPADRPEAVTDHIVVAAGVFGPELATSKTRSASCRRQGRPGPWRVGALTFELAHQTGEHLGLQP
jgi:hypothetical protein